MTHRLRLLVVGTGAGGMAYGLPSRLPSLLQSQKKTEAKPRQAPIYPQPKLSPHSRIRGNDGELTRFCTNLAGRVHDPHGDKGGRGGGAAARAGAMWGVAWGTAWGTYGGVHGKQHGGPTGAARGLGRLVPDLTSLYTWPEFPRLIFKQCLVFK